MDASQYYFRVSSRRMRDKEVQVISWALSDSNSIRCPSPRLDPSRTVFVGGLHGLINAGMCGVGGVLHGVWVVWWVVWDSCMWVGVWCGASRIWYGCCGRRGVLLCSTKDAVLVTVVMVGTTTLPDTTGC